MNETLPFPLYHGTSSIFLNDISTLGLGAKNPVSDLKVKEFLDHLLPLVDSNLQEFAFYERDRHWLQKMAEQSSSHANFQHGQTYLSPSENTAVKYATSNRYGSEILSYCFMFLRALVDYRGSEVIEKLLETFPSIIDLFYLSPFPILIRVHEVPTAALASEHGGDAEKMASNLWELRQKGDHLFHVVGQQMNFRLLAPLSPKNADTFLVNVLEKTGFSPRYELYPLGNSLP